MAKGFAVWILVLAFGAGSAAAEPMTVKQISQILFKAASGSAPDLSHADLGGLDLSDLDFKRAKLFGADLYGANLARLGRTVQVDVPSVITGSTDMGNVSKLVPSLHPMIAVSPPNVALHSHEFTKWAGSEAGHRAIVDGAKALAMTALDVLRDRDLRAAMKASFDADLAAAR